MTENKNFMRLGANFSGEICTDDYPSRFHSWRDGAELEYIEPDTLFGFLLEPARIVKPGMGDFNLAACTYFAMRGPLRIIGGSGFGVARLGHKAMDTIGGPIEAQGRLLYIDGCTDSLLVSPVKKGDPCLNHLHFPPGISQTMHTHPSNRIGVVAGGRGRCVTPDGEIPLLPGTFFCIPKDGRHCFFTDEETMDVIAWHPDSDVGPEDENHPMLSRTIVNGVSASLIPEIQTKREQVFAAR